MRNSYNPRCRFNTYTKESSANATLTVTLTPATGEWAVIRHVSACFNEAAAAGPVYTIIKSGATTIWQGYINDLHHHPRRDFPEGLTLGVVDQALTVDIAVVSGTAKSRVNVVKDVGTTGS